MAKRMMIMEAAVSSSPVIEKEHGDYIDFVAVLQSCDEINRNHRYYPKKVLEEGIDSEYLKERLSTKSLFVECGHPLDASLQRQTTIDVRNAVAMINEIWWEGNLLKAKCETLNTALGRDFKNLIEQGSRVAFSLRAQGNVHQDAVLGATVVDSPIQIITWDYVVNPSHQEAFLQNVCEDTYNALIKPNLFANKEAALCEAATLFEEGSMVEVGDEKGSEVTDFFTPFRKPVKVFSEVYDYKPTDKVVSLKEGAMIVERDDGSVAKVNPDDYMDKDILEGISALDEARNQTKEDLANIEKSRRSFNPIKIAQVRSEMGPERFERARALQKGQEAGKQIALTRNARASEELFKSKKKALGTVPAIVKPIASIAKVGIKADQKIAHAIGDMHQSNAKTKIQQGQIHKSGAKNYLLALHGISPANSKKISYAESAEINDDDLMDMLDENGYEPSDENLQVLKEGLADGSFEIIDENNDIMEGVSELDEARKQTEEDLKNIENGEPQSDKSTKKPIITPERDKRSTALFYGREAGKLIAKSKGKNGYLGNHGSIRSYILMGKIAKNGAKIDALKKESDFYDKKFEDEEPYTPTLNDIKDDLNPKPKVHTDSVNMTDDNLKSLLDENGYEPSDENLQVLKEGLANGSLEIIDENKKEKNDKFDPDEIERYVNSAEKESQREVREKDDKDVRSSIDPQTGRVPAKKIQ